MSLITVLEPVPSRVRAVTRLVATRGPMSRSELQACIVPTGEGKQFGNLVRETIRLGFLREEANQIRLVPNISAQDILDDELFVVLTNKLLVETLLPSDNDNHPIAYAFSWLLARRPSFDLQWNGELKFLMQEDMEGDEIYDVTNASRAAMLASWARFLGYAVGLHWDSKALVVPDPTDAIARYLKSIFEAENSLAVSEFSDRLSKLCPIFEGGAVRNEVEARFRKKRADNTLSPATSLALLRLEQRGVLKLNEDSDAEVKLIDLMHETPRRVSSITCTG